MMKELREAINKVEAKLRQDYTIQHPTFRGTFTWTEEERLVIGAARKYLEIMELREQGWRLVPHLMTEEMRSALAKAKYENASNMIYSGIESVICPYQTAIRAAPDKLKELEEE